MKCTKSNKMSQKSSLLNVTGICSRFCYIYYYFLILQTLVVATVVMNSSHDMKLQYFTLALILQCLQLVQCNGLLTGSTFICDSSSTSDCSNEIIVCENNSNCNITCESADSCQDSAFNAQYARSLHIHSDHNFALRYSTIYFPNNLLNRETETYPYSVTKSQFRGQLICGSKTYQCQHNNFIANYIDSIQIECQGTSCEGNMYQLSHVCFAELLNDETNNLNQCEDTIYLFTMVDVIYLDSAQWWCICENFNNVYVEINSSLVVVNHIVQTLDDIKQCFNYQNGSINIIDYNPNNVDPDAYLDIESVMENCNYMYSGDIYNQTATTTIGTTIGSMQTQSHNSDTSITMPNVTLETVTTAQQNIITNIVYVSKGNDDVSNNTLLIASIIMSVILFGVLVSIFVIMYQMRTIKSINTEQNISAVNAQAQQNAISVSKVQHVDIGETEIIIDEEKHGNDDKKDQVAGYNQHSQSKNESKNKSKTKTESKIGSKQEINIVSDDNDDAHSQASVEQNNASDASDGLFGSTEGDRVIATHK